MVTVCSWCSKKKSQHVWSGSILPSTAAKPCHSSSCSNRYLLRTTLFCSVCQGLDHPPLHRKHRLSFSYNLHSDVTRCSYWLIKNFFRRAFKKNLSLDLFSKTMRSKLSQTAPHGTGGHTQPVWSCALAHVWMQKKLEIPHLLPLLAVSKTNKKPTKP